MRRHVADEIHQSARNQPVAYLLAFSNPSDTTLSVWAIPESLLFDGLSSLPLKEGGPEYTIEIRTDNQRIEGCAESPDLAPFFQEFPLSRRELQVLGESREVDALVKSEKRERAIIRREEKIRVTEIPDEDDNPPKRVRYISSRTVRNTAKGEHLKQLYKYKCQVCGYRIRIPRAGSGLYVEVHHLRPLGGNHRGRDRKDNMLVLCPNCHAEFDAHAMAIDPSTLQIVCYDHQHPHSGRELFFRRGHSLATENLEYHWKCFREATAMAAQKV
jgi:5-methylcytosine-specific restriction endonuclease McrA